MKPYYSHSGVTIYHGDCRNLLARVVYGRPAAIVTDPPYGISYKSGFYSESMARSIAGDKDTSLRDFVLDWASKAPTFRGGEAELPCVVFGSWKVEKPKNTKALLIWDTLGALGMGDLRMPWKPAHQEIYILGSGFTGERTTDVLSYPPVQSMAANGRVHPHQKPVELMTALIAKCPEGDILDPFAGSGTTLVAAKNLGRKAIGIEIEEKYCEIAAKRLSQEVMNFEPQGSVVPTQESFLK